MRNSIIFSEKINNIIVKAERDKIKKERELFIKFFTSSGLCIWSSVNLGKKTYPKEPVITADKKTGIVTAIKYASLKNVAP